MKAIDKAWEENLKLPKEDQYPSKEAIIGDICPYGKYSLNVELEQPKYCTDGDNKEICIKCWNRKIEEENIIQEKNDKLELIFGQLEVSPIDSIGFDDNSEDNLKKSLKRNHGIIFTGSNSDITYDKIPELVAWLQSVYNYCTELKNNMIEYVNFETAKKWMYNNGVAECEGVLYDSSSIFTLEVIDSTKWILIKSE
jgi:hypothetical protein